MMRLERAATWYVTYAALAALSTFIAMVLYGNASGYALIAGAWIAFVVAGALVGCLPGLLPIAWLVTGRRGTPMLVMAVLGGLFGVIAVIMAERFGFTEPGAARETIVPAALIGAVDGWVAEAVSRSWNRAPEVSAANVARFFGFLRPSGEPTDASRALIAILLAGLVAYAWSGQKVDVDGRAGSSSTGKEAHPADTQSESYGRTDPAK
jgi:hypothetical protein